MKKLIFLCLALMLAGFIAPVRSGADGRAKGNPPVILHSFAVEKGYYGYIWKIYIEARDPDGDMSKIAVVVDQPGYGRYPTDWIILGPFYRGHLKGYLQWNTMGGRATRLSEWTHIILTVSIFDRAGNESNEVVFPFSFETGVKNLYRYKLPAPFNQGEMVRLGHIFVDLYDPTLSDGRSPWNP